MNFLIFRIFSKLFFEFLWIYFQFYFDLNDKKIFSFYHVEVEIYATKSLMCRHMATYGRTTGRTRVCVGCH